MIFSSIFFVFTFLPIILFLYYLIPGKGRNLVLLLGSLVFYAWGEPYYIFLMIFCIVFNYLSGIELEYLKKEKKMFFQKSGFG